MIGVDRFPRGKTTAEQAARSLARRRQRVVVIAIGLALGAIVYAATGTRVDHSSKRKPGLWHIVTETGSMTAPSREIRICIDSATEDTLYQLSTNGGSGAACDRTGVRRLNDTLTTEMVCKVGETKITTQTVITYNGDSAYHSEIKAHFDPPTMNGRSGSTARQDAKWLGSCPADMQPGDVVLPGGLRTSLSAPPEKPK